MLVLLLTVRYLQHTQRGTCTCVFQGWEGTNKFIIRLNYHLLRHNNAMILQYETKAPFFYNPFVLEHASIAFIVSWFRISFCWENKG